jgi:hypothetical protein
MIAHVVTAVKGQVVDAAGGSLLAEHTLAQSAEQIPWSTPFASISSHARYRTFCRSGGDQSASPCLLGAWLRERSSVKGLATISCVDNQPVLAVSLH